MTALRQVMSHGPSAAALEALLDQVEEDEETQGDTTTTEEEAA